MERRLAAILAADMVGYSHLTEAEEDGTIARQKVYRAQLIGPTISRYKGRIVKSMGDDILGDGVNIAAAVSAFFCIIARP